MESGPWINRTVVRWVQEGLCHYLHWINLLPELAAQLVTHPADRLDSSVLFRVVLHRTAHRRLLRSYCYWRSGAKFCRFNIWWNDLRYCAELGTRNVIHSTILVLFCINSGVVIRSRGVCIESNCTFTANNPTQHLQPWVEFILIKLTHCNCQTDFFLMKD